MPYCEDCKKFKKEKHNTGFGIFCGTCKKYKNGTNPESDSCSQIDLIDPQVLNRGRMPDKRHAGEIKESEFFE